MIGSPTVSFNSSLASLGRKCTLLGPEVPFQLALFFSMTIVPLKVLFAPWRKIYIYGYRISTCSCSSTGQIVVCVCVFWGGADFQCEAARGKALTSPLPYHSPNWTHTHLTPAAAVKLPGKVGGPDREHLLACPSSGPRKPCKSFETRFNKKTPKAMAINITGNILRKPPSVSTEKELSTLEITWC